MANMKRLGFGQVEPNHLSAQRNGKIYAQLPADASLSVLENGRFVKYDYASGKVNLTGDGEWMLVFNEVKLYDDMWRESYKDFALQASNAVNGEIVPRVFKTDIGDIYTSNCFKLANTSGKAEVEMEEYALSDKLCVNAAGFLEKKETPAAGEMVWKVVKVYTLADGQAALKLQRIA